ncbi:hypothetical protein N665_2774s0002 [Sinapis alba]|nr:hypothetical protein N665_2774s0002 [Sinapis alba]
MSVQPIDTWWFVVKGGKRDCLVDLEHGTCDCGVFAIECIPCPHAIAAATFSGVDVATLVSLYYLNEFLFSGYSENIYPCVGEVEARKCLPPEQKRGPERQKKSIWQSWLELSRFKGRKPRKQHRDYRCSNCQETGHKRPHCTN